MKKVLIVDDEEELVNMVGDYLATRGYDVITALNGKEGLEKMAARPDVILLDVTMPGMDGFEVLHRMRSNLENRRASVIMCTAKSESGSIIEAQNLGVVDYIIKPFPLEVLLAMVRKYA